jgi:thioredoxin-related protein
MNKVILLLLTFSLSYSLTSTAQEIKFETGTWAEIKAKAKKENKLIFMDAYATWCGPCKWMAKNIFTDKTVADYYNANFINAKIDMEKGEGIDIAKEYKVSCYPNLVYIDGDGKLVHRAAGSMEAADFIDLGKTAYTPEKAFSAYQNKYDSGNRSPEFLTVYLDVMSQTCLPTTSVATDYFASIKEEDILQQGNWNLLYHHIADVNSAPFVYLVKNRKAFEEKYTADSVNQKIYDTYLQHGTTIIRSKEEAAEKLMAFEQEIKKSGINRADELLANLNMNMAKSKADWTTWFRNAKVLAENYNAQDASFLNNISWTAFEKVEDPKKLSEVEQWAKKSTELDPKSYNLDTYANLLLKNGKAEQALVAEKKALELAKAGGEDLKPYEEVIAQIEKGLK